MRPSETTPVGVVVPETLTTRRQESAGYGSDATLRERDARRETPDAGVARARPWVAARARTFGSDPPRRTSVVWS